MTEIVTWYALLFRLALILAPVVALVFAIRGIRVAWRQRDALLAWLQDRIDERCSPSARQPSVVVNANATAQAAVVVPRIVVDESRGTPRVVVPNAPDTVQPLALTGSSWRTIVCPTHASQWRQARHMMLVGETSSGKTTLACWIMAQSVSQAEFVILDPHAAPTDWLQLPVIGSGRRYDQINSSLKALLAELDARYQQRSAGNESYPPLLICVDEVPAVASHCDVWPQFIAELSNEGRKVGMRLCILTQGRLVKMLRIEGQSDLRSNFAEILLGVKAVDALPGHDWQQQRPAALDLGGDRVEAIDLTSIVRETPAALSLARMWPDAPESLMLPAMVSTQQSLQNRDDLIRYLVNLGWTTTQIRNTLRGDNNEISAFIARIKEEV